MPTATPLLARFRAGSSSAFGQLFALFYPRAVRHAAPAVAGCGPLTDGEDVAAVAFLHLWQEGTCGRFADELTDTAGLLAVIRLLVAQAARRARRFGRQQKRDGRRAVPLPGDDAPGAAVPSGAGLGSGVDLPAGLTPRQRAVAGLAADGWLNGEIARQLGCSTRTVDRELHALRAALRRDGATE